MSMKLTLDQQIARDRELNALDEALDIVSIARSEVWINDDYPNNATISEDGRRAVDIITRVFDHLSDTYWDLRVA